LANRTHDVGFPGWRAPSATFDCHRDLVKDRAQKASALRYIVAKRWFPQLEIDVLPKISTTKNKLITDIDVLGSVPDEFLGYRAFLFDCKSGRESPINFHCKRRRVWYISECH